MSDQSRFFNKLMKKLPWWAQLLVMALIVGGVFWAGQANQPEPDQVVVQSTPLPLDAPIDTQSRYFLVTSVVDGDTIKINVDDKIQTVRLVGVNTPETVDPRRPVECFGKEASTALREFLLNKPVRLETDATQSDYDRYGRLLRFVFLDDGTDVGLWLLQEGLAQESLYSDQPHKYRQQYVDAQTQAEQAERGLWSPEACSVE